MDKNKLRHVLLTVLFVSPMEAGVLIVSLFLGTISDSPFFLLLRLLLTIFTHLVALLIYLRFLQAFPTAKARR